MKRKNNNKKGFTIVELVIVIAVIAILAAVLIPTFSNIIRKANISNDTQIVRSLNTALAAEIKKPNTMHDALKIAEDAGFIVGNINAKAKGNEIAYDSKNNVFCYYNADIEGENKIEYIPNSIKDDDRIKKEKDYYYLWVIKSEVSDKFSTYYTGIDSSIITTKGFDAGNTTVSSINYTGDSNPKEVVIRTNGGTLTINAEYDTVKHYGIANKVEILAIAPTSYVEKGIVSIAKIKTGRIVVTQEAVLTSIHVVETNGNYDNIKVAVVGNAELPNFTRDDVAMNAGDKKLVIEVQSILTLTAVDESPEYIWISKTGDVVSTDVATSGTTLNEETKVPEASQTATAKVVAGDTVEGTTDEELAEMEAVATRYAGGQGTESNPYLLATKDHFGSIDEDYHNGVSAGKYYKLVTALDLGKIYPIGSLSLSGNNGTSSQGYSVIGGEAFEGHFDGNNHSVTYQMVADDGLGSTSTFGLFGAINNCSIKNLTINADLQCDRASIWVGGLAGFALGNCIFENITMNGSIVGSWDIGGFIGATDDFGTGYFLNCVNNANVTTNNKRTGTNYAVAGGFIGQGNFKNNGTLTFSNCENNGIITVNKANNADLSTTASHFIGFISDSNYGTYVLNDCTIGKDASVVSTIGYTRTVGTKTIYCVYTTESETIVPSIKYIGITNQTWTGATTGLNSRVLINGVQQDTSLYVSASN